jgi:hypothetical protein
MERNSPDRFGTSSSELLRLVRGEGALRLALGEGLLALEKCGGWKSLGYPTLDAYARERLGRSGRWISDARALARRLLEFPDFRPLRQALVEGRLSVSKVELVLKLVSGLTEQPVAQVVEAARYLSVKQLRRLVRHLEGRAFESGDGDERPNAWVTLTRQVDPVDLMAFEYVLKLIMGISNMPGGDISRAQAVEYVLAEGMVSLMRVADVELPSLASAAPSPSSPNDAVTGLSPSTPFRLEPAARPDEAPSLDAEILSPHVWPDSLEEIDAQLVTLSQELARRDLDIGVLGRDCCADKVHLAAGYDNFDVYCREVLQFSPTSMATRVALAERLRRLAPVEDALLDGRIGFEAASILARVSQPTDAEEWVERASRLTVKQLREEVETAKLFGRVSDTPPRPPTQKQMREAEDFERTVYSTLVGRTVPEPSQTENEPEPTPTEESQMSGDSDVERVPLRLSLPPDLAMFWRELEAEHREHLGGEFLPFLVQAALRSWRDSFSHLSKIEYSDVYERDLWKCQNPRCTSRHVTPHHIIFRSAGGGEDRSNLVSLCTICHLELVHGKTARGATLRVSGQAPDSLRWNMGGG